MKRTLQLFLAMAITLTLTLTVTLAPSKASAVSGGTASFDCYLVVDENEAIPDVTFTYEIESGNAAEATSGTPASDGAPAVPGTFAVSAGVAGATITGTVSFSSNDSASTTVAEDDSVTLGTGKKYVKKSVNVDFSSVTFDEVGIYRYVITESVKINDTTYNTDEAVIKKTYTVDGDPHEAIFYTVSQDTQAGNDATRRTRYMDVFVIQGESGLEVSSYVLHKTANLEMVATADASVSDKSNGIVNSISSHSLTFGKKVTGNQASKNKYFKFTLTLGSLGTSEKYAVDLDEAESKPAQTASTAYEEMSNPGIVIADSGALTADFYLKDGQYITIQGLPDNFTYTLSENAEGYISSDGIDPTHNDPVSSTGVTTSIKTGFTNDRSGIIPTGLLLTVTPFVVGLFLFGALFVYMMARKRREY